MRLISIYTTNLKFLVTATVFCSLLSFGQSDKPRMYHDFALDVMAENVKFLAKTEEFANNSNLQKNAKALPEKLDRYNAKEYEAVLVYIADELKVPEETRKKYYSPFHFTKELGNIHHIATHALADIYMTSKNYKEALRFFDKARNTHVPKGTSGTTINKDYLRMEYDVSEAYFELKEYELSSLHLLHNLINGQSYGNSVHEKLAKNEKLVDASSIIPKIDAMLPTIKKGEQYMLTYKYDGKKINFSPFVESVSSSKSTIVNSDFYKNLKKKAAEKTVVSTPKKKSKKALKKVGNFKIDENIFHHYRDINSFINGLSVLRENPAFSKNANYIAAIDGCIEYLEANNFHKATKEISYIMDNSFSINKALLESLSDDEEKVVRNVQHFAAHYKLDMLMHEKQYPMALAPIHYIRTVAGFDYKAEKNKEIGLDTQKLFFIEAQAYNGIAESEFSILHLLGALMNAPEYEADINQLMLKAGNTIGKERVTKLLTQTEANIQNEYSDNLKLASAPFTVDVVNFQKLQPNEIIAKIKASDLYKTYIN